MVNAVYTRNRSPTRVLPLITPEETWSKRRPWITHMRVFGCIAYAIVPLKRRVNLMQRVPNVCS